MNKERHSQHLNHQPYPTVPQPPADTPCPVVLLVEDSEDDAYFFNRTFAKSGVAGSVNHSANGAIAVEFLKNAMAPGSADLPILIFLDLKMPVMNGFDVLEWLQNSSLPKDIPVVVLSGSEQQPDKDKAKGLGAKDYLVKPVRAADLVRLFKELCPKYSKVMSFEGQT